MNPSPRSATDVALGERFAEALAAKDRDTLVGLCADPMDFQALTPGRLWAATDPQQVVDEFVLGSWFPPDARVDALEQVGTGRVGSRERVTYRLRIRRGGQEYLVEQHAYYDTDEKGRMGFLRLVCSGYCLSS